jgi:hypothetical protein
MSAPAKNLIGQRFGRLIVRERSPGKYPRAYWVCDCDCGSITVVSSSNLKCGGAQSCGCLLTERVIEYRRIRHLNGWRSRHPLYTTWYGIMRRCLFPQHKAFKWYGARGITICESWRSFENFIADIEATIGPRPDVKLPSGHPRYSLHRILNHGNYEPGNVKWATWREQHSPESRRMPPRGLVKRNSIVIGDTNLTDACRHAGVDYDGVRYQVKRLGKTPSQAIAHFERRKRLGLKPYGRLKRNH